MTIIKGDIVPGIRIGEFVIGTLKEEIMVKIKGDYKQWERGDGFCTITLENAKMWFDTTQRLQQIAVTKGFQNQYNTIGIGSTMKDVVEKFGAYENDGVEYLIKGTEGICFELGDMDEWDDYWDELYAPIEWICVYKI